MEKLIFDPGFGIRPVYDPLGFEYEETAFGPEVENRRLDAIRSSLMDPECEGPDIVYSIAMDVGEWKDREEIEKRNLLYGAVTYARGLLGKEPVRSQGHIHAVSPSCGASTCEVYEIWSGSACIYMQETANDDPGRCFAVLAGPGEVVIVPPGWAHCTIVADPTQNMTFGAWCVRDYGFDYTGVRAHKGVAWFPVIEDGELQFLPNRQYGKSHIMVKHPRHYLEFGLETGIPIYRQFQEDPDRFLFVAQPDVAEKKWHDFIP